MYTLAELDEISERTRAIAEVLTRYAFTFPITDEDVAIVLANLDTVCRPRWLSVVVTHDEDFAQFAIFTQPGVRIYDRTMLAGKIPCLNYSKL